MLAIVGGVLTLSEGILFVDPEKQLNTPATLFLSLFLVLIVLVFWYLDAFFLNIERLYREVYKWVVENRPHTDKYLYDLNTFERQIDNKTEKLRDNVPGVYGLMISKTLFPFYFLPFLFVLGLLIFQIVKPVLLNAVSAQQP